MPRATFGLFPTGTAEAEKEQFLRGLAVCQDDVAQLRMYNYKFVVTEVIIVLDRSDAERSAAAVGDDAKGVRGISSRPPLFFLFFFWLRRACSRDDLCVSLFFI